jgi:hypothetical protein
MIDDVDRRKVVKGHGMKRRQHEAKLKALENPTVVTDPRWENLPQPWLYTLCSSYV